LIVILDKFHAINVRNGLTMQYNDFQYFFIYMRN